VRISAAPDSTTASTSAIPLNATAGNPKATQTDSEATQPKARTPVDVALNPVQSCDARVFQRAGDKALTET
jgi:hypothetical protein